MEIAEEKRAREGLVSVRRSRTLAIRAAANIGTARKTFAARWCIIKKKKKKEKKKRRERGKRRKQDREGYFRVDEMPRRTLPIARELARRGLLIRPRTKSTENTSV